MQIMSGLYSDCSIGIMERKMETTNYLAFRTVSGLCTKIKTISNWTHTLFGSRCSEGSPKATGLEKLASRKQETLNLEVNCLRASFGIYG